MAEEWREIPSHPGYFASSEGRIRGKSGKVLALYVAPSGYVQAAVEANGKRCSRRVHRLVAEAFHGPGIGMDACHQDGVRANNRPDNLKWGTRARNIADKIAHGTNNGTTRSPLTERDVLDIRASAVSYRKLAAQYGVSKVTIWEIKARRTWAQL